MTGASRTDAGVHALGQAASLATASALGPRSVQAALNALLPPDIRVLTVSEAPPGFDARRAACGKRYVYLVDNGPVASPLMRRYAWHVRRRLDFDGMRAALAALRGRHDFSAFCAAPGLDRDPTCTVRSARVVTGKRLAAVLLSADSFLHRMVRNIVGSAVEVGLGRRDPGWLRQVLEGRDRRRAGPTAPPQGLVLLRVLYPEAGRGDAVPPGRAGDPASPGTGGAREKNRLESPQRGPHAAREDP